LPSLANPCTGKWLLKRHEFILKHQWLNGRFQRLNYQGQVSVLAQSEDFAYFIKALLDLQTAKPQETGWLEAAIWIYRGNLIAGFGQRMRGDILIPLPIIVSI
jgi:uncharacterized protein YyaL (SSP411 family)